MDAGTTWERLLHTPTTWVVVAAVLFVVAVVLLVAGARAGRRAARARRAEAAAGVTAASAPADEDPVTEPSIPRRVPAPVEPVAAPGDDPVTEPSVPGAAGPARAEPDPVESDPAVHRLLDALVDDPRAALAGVAALERGEQPGRVAVTLLRSGVPAPAVARLCGVDADDLGGLVATTLGVLPERGRTAAASAADDAGAVPAWAGTPSR